MIVSSKRGAGGIMRTVKAHSKRGAGGILGTIKAHLQLHYYSLLLFPIVSPPMMLPGGWPVGQSADDYDDDLTPGSHWSEGIEIYEREEIGKNLVAYTTLPMLTKFSK